MEQNKTHWKSLCHPDYIGAYALMDGTKDGKELVVTIVKVSREMVTGADGKKEECTVCQLKGIKPMILNATNQKTMQKLFGSPFIDDWVGNKMTLYVAKVRAFGETVDALRIRETKPKLQELTPTHEKWNAAKKALSENNTTIEQIRTSYILSPDNEKLILA